MSCDFIKFSIRSPPPAET